MSLLKKEGWVAVVDTHLNLNTWEAEARRCLEFKASQIYRVKLRTAMDTKKKPMLRENKILSL